MGKWLLVITFLILAIITAFVVFLATGVVTPEDTILKWAGSVDWIEPHLETYSIGQEAESWRQEQQSLLDNENNRLEQLQADLDKRTEELDDIAASLEVRENNLLKEQEQFNARAAKLRSTQRLAEMYASMDPTEAARILQELEQSTILEILVEMDIDLAAEIITLFPTDLAASLSRSLRFKPGQ